MSDADVTTTDDTFGNPMHLMGTALGSRHFADLARSFADDAAELVDAVTALAAPSTSRHLAQMRRRARAADRNATRTAEHALRTADAIRDMLAAASPAERRQATRRLASAGEASRRAILSTHRHAAIVGRLAAGIAARHEPCDGPEPIWTVARRLLGNLALGPGDDDIAIAAPAGAGRTMLTGLLAHIGWQAPAFVVITVDDGSERYVQAMIDAGTLLVESVDDTYLAVDQRLSPQEQGALLRLGFNPPDGGHLNWWQEVPDCSVRDATDLLAATLSDVHGAGDLGVTATLSRAWHHPSYLQEVDDPAALELDLETESSLATAMADRLRTWIDHLGVDAIWATVDQDGWPHWAHLGSNLDGSLYTEVSGQYLAADDVARLRALGWGEADAETGMHPRVWPAPFDLDVVCWHMAITLVNIHGLQLDEPILVTMEPFG